MKKSTKRLLLLATAAASMYAYNRYVEEKSTSKNLLNASKGFYYDWKLGRIYYTKEGEGSPILLVHDTQPSSSSFDWFNVIRKLKKNHTVYTIDLLGCGRSDKPEISYTNYLYVQLISSFVKNIIQEKTDVVASNLSTSFVLMANHMDSELFNKIILINPVSIRQTQIMPDIFSKIKKRIINLPLLGTFIYNITMSPKVININLSKIFSADIKISSKNIDVLYESAHLKEGKGKYLYSSILGNYMNLDIYRAVKNTKKQVFIIASQKLNKSILIANEYHKINSRFEIRSIASGSPYPQMEDPGKIIPAISNIID